MWFYVIPMVFHFLVPKKNPWPYPRSIDALEKTLSSAQAAYDSFAGARAAAPEVESRSEENLYSTGKGLGSILNLFNILGYIWDQEILYNIYKDRWSTVYIIN